MIKTTDDVNYSFCRGATDMDMVMDNIMYHEDEIDWKYEHCGKVFFIKLPVEYSYEVKKHG